MTISKDKIGALIYFIFSVCYGYYAYEIPLYPGEEFDVFTSQTMPLIYAVASIIISVLALILSIINDIKTKETKETSNETPQYDKTGWIRCFTLLLLMVFYGATLELLGFILSTILFLIMGYLILGERRPKILIIASVPVVIVFWAIMTQLLGIYLSSGDLWS